nr:hypothetical protein [Candidatus Njordarchaeum guaymaensis]
MSLASLAEAIKKELTTLGIPAVLEMALVSTAGKTLYSDMSKPAMSKISPFYDSLLIMGQGDNLSLAVDSTKTIVASRVSARTILIALTDKKVGIVLTKMGSVADKFGRLLDELIALEESKGGAMPIPIKQAAPEEVPSPPALTPVAEVQPPPPLSRPVSREATARPAVSPRRGTERVIVPTLTDLKVLEKCPEKERRFLELFDGALSLNDIAKRLGVPFFDALQIANKYKNMRKVDMKEVIRG